MDAKTVEMLAKGLQAHKRKGKASGESSKKIRINISSSTALANATTATKIADGIEVAFATEVGAIDGAIVPPTFLSPPTEVEVPELPIGAEKRAKKKEKK